MNELEMTMEKIPLSLATCMAPMIEQLRKDKKRAAVHTYRSTLNSFLDYAAREGIVTLIDEVFTVGRLKEYEMWLLQKGLSWNSISTYLRTLRAVYNRLEPPGSPGHNPKLFDDVYTKVDSLTKRALTAQQTRILMTTDLDTLPEELRSVLAYFLLMFYFRGMPFIDLAHLRKQDLKGDNIVYCRHKTGKQLTVRIPKEAMELLNRYKDTRPDSVYLFPILDSELKKEWEVYQCYLSALSFFNKKLTKVGAILLPGTRISSYTARHTWATLCYHQNIPIGIISEALGHSSIRVTEAYLKPFAYEKVNREHDKLIELVMNGKEEVA